jgi:hypothetical protein
MRLIEVEMGVRWNINVDSKDQMCLSFGVECGGALFFSRSKPVSDTLVYFFEICLSQINHLLVADVMRIFIPRLISL